MKCWSFSFTRASYRNGGYSTDVHIVQSMNKLINLIVSCHDCICVEKGNQCLCTIDTDIDKIMALCDKYQIECSKEDLHISDISKDEICHIENCPNEYCEKYHINSKLFLDQSCTLATIDHIIQCLLEDNSYIQWFTEECKMDIRCIELNVDSGVICEIFDIRS